LIMLCPTLDLVCHSNRHITVLLGRKVGLFVLEQFQGGDEPGE